MLSLLFAFIFVLAVVDVAKQTESMGVAKKVAVGTAAYVVGVTVLLVASTVMGSGAGWGLLLLLDEETASRLFRSKWFDRVIGLAVTVALYYPFHSATQWLYRKAGGQSVATSEDLPVA